jgi:phytoene dehydrogenase-like protein
MANKAVIIGTGAGGLLAAASLAHAGYDVTALERGEQLGGYLNPFARRHYWFDPGVHYMGQCGRGELTYETLAAIGVDPGVLFCELERDGYDVLRFPGFELRICAGLDAYQARLIDAFEQSREELERYFDLLRVIARLFGFGSAPLSLKSLAQLPDMLEVLSGSFAALLETKISDPRLRSVLAAQCGDAGLPPSKLSALTGISTMLHFAEAAYFPRGGSGRLRDAIVEAGRAHGAHYRCNAEVARIHVARGRVRGVELVGGERLEADVVISAIDPTLTYGRLLDPHIVPDRMLAKIHRTEPSLASICVFLGVERDLRDHGMRAANVWDFPSWDLDAVFEPLLAGRLPERDWAFMLSPNSLKDDSGAMAPPGCSTLEIVALACLAPFARWQHTHLHERDADYHALKARIADGLLASVEQRWPGLIGDVVVREVSTPLTNIHYVNAPNGGIYGPAATPAQAGLRRFRASTPISGLFLAGAGVFGCGVATCLMSGAHAAELARESARSRLSQTVARAARRIGSLG